MSADWRIAAWVGLSVVLATDPLWSREQNLVHNGSFEEVVHDSPFAWERTEQVAEWSVDSGRDNSNALRIDRPDSRQTDAFSPAGVIQSGIELVASQRYVLAFSAKGQDVGEDGLGVGIYDSGQPVSPALSVRVTPTREWREFRFEFFASAMWQRQILECGSLMRPAARCGSTTCRSSAAKRFMSSRKRRRGSSLA